MFRAEAGEGLWGWRSPRRRVHARAGQQTLLVTGQMVDALGSVAVLNFALVGRRQPWTETKVAWLCSSKALLTFIYKNWGWAGRPRDGVSELFSGGGLGGGGPRVTRDPLPLSPCHKATSVGFLSTGGWGLSHRRRCCTAQAGAPGQTFTSPLADLRGGNGRRQLSLRMPRPAARVAVCSGN